MKVRADFSELFFCMTYPVELLRSYHMVSQYRGMHLDPFFEDHLVPFIMQGPLGPLVANVLIGFLGPLGPNLTFVSCFNFLCYIFGLASFAILFSLFFASDVKAAATRAFGGQLCEKLWLSVFNSRADNTVINYCKSFCKFKA